MGEGIYLLSFVLNTAAILNANILAQSIFFPIGIGSTSISKKSRIVSEINYFNLLCNISCGSKCIKTEICNIKCCAKCAEYRHTLIAAIHVFYNSGFLC